MKHSLLFGVAAALMFAAPAIASTGWTANDAKTAIRGLGYPKPHPRNLACKGAGTDTFHCVATYRHHRRNRFVIESVSGPWLCAGKTLGGCKALRHGFVTGRQIAQRYNGYLATFAEFAARDYMGLHYGIDAPNTAPGGGQTGPTTWTFRYYTTDTTTVLVTISAKRAKGGYVISGSAS